MIENEFEIDGIPVWESECAIEEGKQPEDYILGITYKGSHHFIWTYNEVEDAVDNGVEQLLAKYITFERVKESHVKELHTFLKHWAHLIKNNNNPELFGGEL
jgi:hypothetical protein